MAAKQFIKLDILATCLSILRTVGDLTIFLIPSYNLLISKSAKYIYRKVLADNFFEEIRILYEGIKKMVKSQTVRSIIKLVASMSSLMRV